MTWIISSSLCNIPHLTSEMRGDLDTSSPEERNSPSQVADLNFIQTETLLFTKRYGVMDINKIMKMPVFQALHPVSVCQLHKQNVRAELTYHHYRSRSCGLDLSPGTEERRIRLQNIRQRCQPHRATSWLGHHDALGASCPGVMSSGRSIRETSVNPSWPCWGRQRCLNTSPTLMKETNDLLLR